jgi:hypothetical protein
MKVSKEDRILFGIAQLTKLGVLGTKNSPHSIGIYQNSMMPLKSLAGKGWTYSN